MRDLRLPIISVFSKSAVGITSSTHQIPSPIEASNKLVVKSQIRHLNLTTAERQKRLLPYINFYHSQDLNQPINEEYYQTDEQYEILHPTKDLHLNKYSELIGTTYPTNEAHATQQIIYRAPIKAKFTPFHERNALPGPFIPIIHSPTQKIKITYTPLEQRERIPNYSAIYDKLAQLKFKQNIFNTEAPYKYETVNNPQHIIRKPEINIIPVHEYQEAPPPSKTFIHTYSPTNIEIPSNQENFFKHSKQQIPIKYVSQTKPIQQFQDNIIVTQEPIRVTPLYTFQNQLQRPVVLNEQSVRQNQQYNYMPMLTFDSEKQYTVQQKQYHNQNHKQYLQEVIPVSKPFIIIPQNHYTPKSQNEPIKINKPIIILQSTISHNKPYANERVVIPNYKPTIDIPTFPEIIVTPPNEQSNSNSLSQILKKLQDSNALPHTLTPDNIDNSIKTLVRILNTLKKQQLTKPIVVAEEPVYKEYDNEPEVQLKNKEQVIPGTVTQVFPAHTQEGGTPGRPGVDYPALSTIPHTKFNCKTQRYKGFFADPDTHCQVWHYCDLNGGQASFLCPNGTIFSQVALTCDWWFNVKCSTTTQLYVLNERLYKYIIPLTPKFPEDYSGPLVDRYLAIKFKEMEEKIKKEKKQKKPSYSSTEENELPFSEDKNTERPSRTFTKEKNQTIPITTS